jgi:NADPH:quinone reductase-like Zn-dependent oxidoreductase
VATPTTLAVRIERHGPPETLVERRIPLPDPGPDEAHLRVEATGVNFADLMMRTGIYATVPPRPYSPGFEAAGVVERVGPGVTEWRAGDRAVALLRHGAYAHDLVVPKRNLFPYPATLTPVEAAAVPVAFLTAWVCLHETGHARADETLLVLNAAGGVGSAAVQLGRQAGMRVFGTAGAERKRRFVIDELGAEACFDSRGDWEAEARERLGDRGLDVALDAVGGRATGSCRRLLGPLGRLVFYGLSDAMPSRRRNPLSMARAWLRTPRFHPLSLVEPNIGVFGVHLLHLQRKEDRLRPVLERVFAQVAAGALRPIVDRTFPLDAAGAADAHRYIHGRQAIGKIVLQVPA